MFFFLTKYISALCSFFVIIPSLFLLYPSSFISYFARLGSIVAVVTAAADDQNLFPPSSACCHLGEAPFSPLLASPFFSSNVGGVNSEMGGGRAHTLFLRRSKHGVILILMFVDVHTYMYAYIYKEQCRIQKLFCIGQRIISRSIYPCF